MSIPLRVSGQSTFDGVRSAAPGGASPTGRLRPSAATVASIALSGPALVDADRELGAGERDRSERRGDHQLRGFPALDEFQSRRGERPQEALQLRFVRREVAAVGGKEADEVEQLPATSVRRRRR